jgi:hypothetical protein
MDLLMGSKMVTRETNDFGGGMDAVTMGMGISFDELAGSDGTLRQRSTINLQSPQQY